MTDPMNQRRRWRQNFYDWVEHPEFGQPLELGTRGAVAGGSGVVLLRNHSAVSVVYDEDRPEAGRNQTVIDIFENRRREDHLQFGNELVRRGLQGNFVEPMTYESESDHCGWFFQKERLSSWGFFSAKKGSDSEDSEPLFVHADSNSTHRLFIGVFDGMGGAGAGRTTGSEHTYTEAYRASRILRNRLLHDMSLLIPDALRLGRGKAIGTHELTKKLSEELARMAEKPGLTTASRIRGTLSKTLPSTVACAEIKFQDVQTNSSRKSQVGIRAIWAGDSRVWVLTPANGLQQISKDDVDIDDCLEQIRQDPPMHNVASASVPFHLNEHEVIIKEPCLVLVATDGVFGYVRSPGEVELLLLNAIATSGENPELLARELFEVFRAVAKDDASATLVSCGFNSLSECAKSFDPRKKTLEMQYSTIDEIDDSNAFSAAVDSQWERERMQYTAVMAGKSK